MKQNTECNRDCLNCVYADCIREGMDHQDYTDSRKLDRDFVSPRSAKQEARSAREKARYQENREAVIAQKKAYYQKNREAVLAKHQVYRSENKESIAAYKRHYYRENREKWNAYLWEYRRKKRLLKAENGGAVL